MNARRMHHVLALALLLVLPACTVAIGAAPENAPNARRDRPRDVLFIPASRPAAAADEAPAGEAFMAPGAELMIPVRGIRPEQLHDTYNDPRSGGRVHNAIDIMAPAGAPVVAAADGTIHRLRTGGLGGITIYQIGADGRTLYYYAHLQRYAAGVREGMPLRRGEVIAYVGDTGNAGAGNYHLHFSVGRLTDMSRWWDSQNVNPFPLLIGDLGRHGSMGGRRDR
ncbi:M23 family metallopeptidase [Longimicrobium sp.]|uniref:M23 family metallopeptidase n=1 Tax=Longimicrobium sp. TaxID=2029185 RepID=UPI002E361853|nr:M23 family metallopeptidase [Longimicrobium sp.]HEX6038843.1 M23 family metallopeptidase [Longimicrobium sp.]